MTQKQCTNCQHFQWFPVETVDGEDGCNNFSTGGLTCSVNNFCEENPADTTSFRVLMKKAETCRDFAEPDFPIIVT